MQVHCDLYCSAPTAHISAFYFFFFAAVGGYFAAHLAVFVAVTPAPRENITPWNFGKYAYPNYPNAKLGTECIAEFVNRDKQLCILTFLRCCPGLVAVPPIIVMEGSRAVLPATYESKFEELLYSANLCKE